MCKNYHLLTEEQKIVKRQKSREYYYAHREQKIEYQRKQYWKDPTKAIAAAVQHGKDHPEMKKARQHRYAITHRAKLNADWHKRRSRIKFNGGYHTSAEWQEVLDKYNNTCIYCGTRIKMTKDHRIPINRGGTNDISNIVPACLSCNSTKRDNIWEPNCRILVAV